MLFQPPHSPVIMRTFKARFTYTLGIAALAIPLSAAAQQTIDASPPKLEKLEEGEAPAINIRKPDNERKITEKRDQGKVTEVKVQSGNSTYYLKPNESAGSAQPGDGESSSNRAPQWQVMEFGNPKATKEADPPQTLAPAPQAGETPATAK
jgi:hypothetical protein